MAATMQAEFSARPRPAAPVPHDRALTPLQVIREMGRNPIAAFGIHAYQERYIYSRNWVQDFMLVGDPDGIKYVLLDNAANYQKSIQFQRLTRPALGNGLVVLDPSAKHPTLDFFSTNYERLKVALYAVTPADFDAYLTAMRNQWNHDRKSQLPGRKVSGFFEGSPSSIRVGDVAKRRIRVFLSAMPRSSPSAALFIMPI